MMFRLAGNRRKLSKQRELCEKRSTINRMYMSILANRNE